jgi:hypothetical protein
MNSRSTTSPSAAGSVILRASSPFTSRSWPVPSSRLVVPLPASRAKAGKHTRYAAYAGDDGRLASLSEVVTFTVPSR